MASPPFSAIFASALVYLLLTWPKTDATITLVTKASRKIADLSQTLAGSKTNVEGLNAFKKSVSELKDITPGSLFNFKAQLERLVNDAKADELHAAMRGAKLVVKRIIDDEVKNSSMDVKKLLGDLKKLFDSNAQSVSEVNRILNDIYMQTLQQRAKIKEAHVKAAAGGELYDLPKKDFSAVENLSSFLSYLDFDPENGRFSPEAILRKRASPQKRQALLDTLTNLHESVVQPQKELGDQRLGEFLRSRICKKLTRVGRLCPFYDCPKDVLRRKVNYILSVLRLGFAWLEVLTMIDCQTAAKDPAGKIECLDRDRLDSPPFNVKAIRKQGKKFLKAEEKALNKLLTKTEKDRKKCECSPGTFADNFKTGVGGVSEFLCVQCPKDFYSTKPGSKECQKCPEHLDSRVEEQRPCIEQKLMEINRGLAEKEKKIEKQMAKIGEMEKKIEALDFLCS